MNLYFILEGDNTETIVYPAWIKKVLPMLSRVNFETEVCKNNYYIFSGGGIPSIYNHINNAIKNINDNPVFDKLVICLDGEEVGTEKRIQIVKDKINKENLVLNERCEIVFIIQNVCIESWFLGNRKIMKRTPTNEKLRSYIDFFDVSGNDPEEMDKMPDYRNKAHFHFSYLREVFKERNIRYSKSKPKEVAEATYFNELVKRTNETTDLPTLKVFLDFLEEVKIQINESKTNGKDLESKTSTELD